MGLIKAAMGAVGGVMADQWKEFFYCDSLSQDILVAKGQKRTSSRSSNTSGEDNIISKKGEVFHGHEFHYSKVIVNDLKHPLAFKITRGKGSYNNMDGFMEKNTLASYVHTHVAAMPNFGGNLAISSRELGD